MKYYFRLQYKRFSRWSEHLGIHPTLGIILGLAFFFILSKLLFYKIDYAHWILLVFAIFSILSLTDSKRNESLKNIYSKTDFYKIRLVENSIMALPFLILLLLETELLSAFIIFPSIVLLAFIKTKQYWLRTIPTPFKRFPFEFIVGFRKTFWFIALVYFVIIKAIQVDNYYLSLFGLAVVFFTCMAYYQKPEHEYYVWIHIHQSKEFLIKKFYTLLKCASILSILPLIAIMIGFPSNWWITLLVYIAANILLSSVIVAKYSSYPFEMNLPQGILYSISLLFPPILIFTIRLFYKKSKQQLEQILG